MATLAPSIRFDLAQAVDAQRFGTDRTESGIQHQQLQKAALLEAALAQPARQPVPLEEQVTPPLPLDLFQLISLDLQAYCEPSVPILLSLWCPSTLQLIMMPCA